MVIIPAGHLPKTVETLHNCRNMLLKWKVNLTDISRRRPRLDCEDHTLLWLFLLQAAHHWQLHSTRWQNQDLGSSRVWWGGGHVEIEGSG